MVVFKSEEGPDSSHMVDILDQYVDISKLS